MTHKKGWHAWSKPWPYINIAEDEYINIAEDEYIKITEDEYISISTMLALQHSVMIV